ncbi:hypothetical protein RQC66_06005 [Streptomyces justiciae]|uniref:PknH-like extracellular domain-containing protein n=2 Tax=Streptomyces justiciae TaxID=2780140 RepID=A0ABU3LMI4_9ACTN|nr:hypothetical protein [Streptomyces justiciae]MDT7840278.1 hypothetical protein [Streptomyces justiciae]
MRNRAGALLAVAVTGLALGATLASPADAAAPKTSPKFLSASELPPHPSSSWTAGKVTDGVPDGLLSCLQDTMPGYDSRYRAFHTDLDTGALQLTIVVGDTAKAKALATRLNKDIRTCPTRLEQADPEIEATHRNYGALPVEEGARVHGLHIEGSWGASDIHLLSVGRDGKTVTVVQWGQLGDFADAPVKAFRKTTTTAVNKLY